MARDVEGPHEHRSGHHDHRDRGHGRRGACLRGAVVDQQRDDESAADDRDRGDQRSARLVSTLLSADIHVVDKSSTGPPEGVSVTEVRFVGGMNVPSAMGRANATMPLAELTVRDGELVLRPRLFGAWILTDFAVPLSGIARAYPLRGRVMTAGVGLSLTDGQVAYFWTFDRAQVLAALASVGVPVESEPQRASRVWSLWRPGTTATRTPRLPRPLVALFPLLALASVLVLVWLLVSSPSPSFRVFIVLFWSVLMVIDTRVWWHSR